MCRTLFRIFFLIFFSIGGTSSLIKSIHKSPPAIWFLFPKCSLVSLLLEASHRGTIWSSGLTGIDIEMATLCPSSSRHSLLLMMYTVFFFCLEKTQRKITKANSVMITLDNMLPSSKYVPLFSTRFTIVSWLLPFGPANFFEWRSLVISKICCITFIRLEIQ